MKKLFDKNEVIFAVILIVIYVAGSTLMVQLSEMIGTGFLAEAVFGIVLFAVLAVFIVKNRLGRHLGLCKPEVSAARMLFYIPLTIIAAVGVIFGFAPQYEPVTLAVHTVYMLFVGILEEIIFRGFLFRGMAKKNMTSAIIVSAATFGVGHIVNLLNGQNLPETVSQIIFAVFVGFALVILFHKGKSLVPCIVFHGVFNALSIVMNDEALYSALGGPVSAAVIMIAASAAVLGGYSLWNWKHLEG